MKFQIFKGKDGQFYFRLVAKNGRKLMVSEGYRRYSHIRKIISTIIYEFETEIIEIEEKWNGRI